MHRTETANNINNLFTEGPPATTVGASWLNSVQEEIANAIEYSGQTLQTAATDNYSQLTTAIQTLLGYDFIVDTPLAFVDIIERTGANTYQIKDEYLSVFFRQKIGGYSIASILSDGDTWGKIETNKCNNIIFESGAYFNFGDTQSYLEVNTDYCYLKNVEIRGIGTSAAAITQSFLLNADFVTYDGCKTRNRKSNVEFSGFKGSGTDSHNKTSKYLNCTVYSLESSNNMYGFNTCYFLSNCKALTLSTSIAMANGFKSCDFMILCLSKDCNGTTGNGNARGFDSCSNLTSCAAENNDTVDGNCIGFYSCNQISACYATNLNITGTGEARGFSTCRRQSTCYATNISSNSGDAHGFYNCIMLSACYTDNISSTSGTATGFSGCVKGAAIDTNEAINPNNDYIDTVDAQVTNKTSCDSIFT